MVENSTKKRGRKSKKQLEEEKQNQQQEEVNEESSEENTSFYIPTVKELANVDKKEEDTKSVSNASSDGSDVSVDLPQDLESNTGTEVTESENEEDYQPSLQAEELANILSAFFHNDDGENVTDMLGSIRDSIDKNSRCLIKLSQVIERFLKE